MRIEIQKLKSGVEAQLPPNLLKDLEKYQTQVVRFSSLMDQIQKGESEKLRRLISLETDLRQLEINAKFLTNKKLEIDTKLMQEIQPLKQFKALCQKRLFSFETRLDNISTELLEKCGLLESDINSLKEPLQIQVQDIKQEKESMARELEKIYNNQRKIEIMRSQNNYSPP